MVCPIFCTSVDDRHEPLWRSERETTVQACKESSITEQTYCRWRKEYGGLQVDQAKRLKELEQENAKLKRLVANLSLDNLVLKDLASGNF